MYWIYRLVHQEYWKRAWIVQEIGMASKIQIYFGRQSIPWSELVKLVRFYDRKVEDPTVGHILKLEDLRLSKYRDGQAYSVSNLLNTFRDSFCLVKHDKIYAFLGMAGDFVNGVITIAICGLPSVFIRTSLVYRTCSVRAGPQTRGHGLFQRSSASTTVSQVVVEIQAIAMVRAVERSKFLLVRRMWRRKSMGLSVR